MPNYDFSCTKCEFVITDVQLPIAGRNVPCEEPCPKCGEENSIERLFAAPIVSYTINNGGLKTPETFKDILRNVKSKVAGANFEIR